MDDQETTETKLRADLVWHKGQFHYKSDLEGFWDPIDRAVKAMGRMMDEEEDNNEED